MSPGPPYEVFLSFRGTDTRDNFAKFLHMMLKKALVHVFIDEENLKTGADMNDGLIEAINQSTISIPIISKDFASSYSCLMELETMSKCMDERNHIVIPIFYYIEPRDVRNCKGPFAESKLGRKDKRKRKPIKKTVIRSWISALKRIGDINGHHLHKENKREHIKIIKQIIDDVQQKLTKEDLLTGTLVGVDPHVKRIMELLDVDYHKGQASKIGDAHKKVLLIHGLAGVGKTALAKHVYNQLHRLFDACSFPGEIPSKIEPHRVLSVRNKLISDLHKGNVQAFKCPDKAMIHIQRRFTCMKVLVLLDDVKSHNVLRRLFGELDWLGPGSRVILTSKTNDVLGKINGAESFHLETMKQDKALILFCRTVFGTDLPREEFRDLPADIVAATSRLPAALEIVGLYLRDKTPDVWQEILTELKKGCNQGVKEALKKSYGDLNRNERQIFLDIACFLIGIDKRIPYYMWSDLGRFPAKSILALHARSLIEIQDNKLCMLEILKEFGRTIVKDESHQPWKRSRVWNPEEALNVLSMQGAGQVTALGLKFRDGHETRFHYNHTHFNGLKNLRFLKLDLFGLEGDFRNCFSSLRWLDWQGASRDRRLILNLQKVVILDLSGSQVDKDWRGWKVLVEAGKLKVLKLTSCFQLIDTPKFPLSMELERLILEGCSRLAFTDRSISYLDKLVSLNMKKCNRLSELPNLGFMTRLEELVIDGTSISRIDFQEGSMKMLKTISACGCKDLTKVSDSIGHLKSLEYLALDGTKIRTLPESIVLLEKLETLSLKNCRALTHLPNGIEKLRSLQFLDLSKTAIRELPPSVKDWVAMKVLRMSGTAIKEFPKAILNLEKLEEIDFSSCPNLKGSIQDLDIGKLSSLTILKLSRTQICCQRESFDCLTRLHELDIDGCDNLQRSPQSPASLINPSTLVPHVMIEGVGENRGRDERERERECVEYREGNMEKKWAKRPRLQ